MKVHIRFKSGLLTKPVHKYIIDHVLTKVELNSPSASWSSDFSVLEYDSPSGMHDIVTNWIYAGFEDADFEEFFFSK